MGREGLLDASPLACATVRDGWSDQPQRDLDEGVAAALEAVRLETLDPYAHDALAIVANFSGHVALALHSVETLAS